MLGRESQRLEPAILGSFYETMGILEYSYSVLSSIKVQTDILNEIAENGYQKSMLLVLGFGYHTMASRFLMC